MKNKFLILFILFLLTGCESGKPLKFVQVAVYTNEGELRWIKEKPVLSETKDYYVIRMTDDFKVWRELVAKDFSTIKSLNEKYPNTFLKLLPDKETAKVLKLNVEESPYEYLKIKWQAGGWDNWDSWNFSMDELRILGRNKLRGE